MKLVWVFFVFVLQIREQHLFFAIVKFVKIYEQLIVDVTVLVLSFFVRLDQLGHLLLVVILVLHIFVLSVIVIFIVSLNQHLLLGILLIIIFTFVVLFPVLKHVLLLDKLL